MDLATTNELRDLLPYLTPQENAEIDSLINAVQPVFSHGLFVQDCARYLYVQDKQGEIVPLQLNRAQRQLIANLTGRDIILKARQLGMSTAVQAKLFHEQLLGGARTATLCHEDDLTGVLRRMVDRFYAKMPDSMRPARRYANAKLTAYAELNSEGSIATVGGTAGTRKGRGGSVTYIHGSEVAYWPDAESVMAAALQAGNPEIILESTPNGMTGWFYERCMEALSGNGVWTLHFFPWWWDDEYTIPLTEGDALDYTEDEQKLVDAHGLTVEQINWRRQKQAELGRMFPQEYPEDPYSCFLASGKSFFGDVEHVFTAPQDAQPHDGRKYVGGLDFAQTGDYTTLAIIDSSTREQVDLLHINNEQWQEMRRQVSVMANKWDAEVHGEANSMGTTNIELLQTGETLADGTRIEPIKLIPFDTTATSKPPLIQGLHYALHEAGLTLLDDPAQRHELRAFISKQTANGHWQYEGGDGAHDDTVIALALAWHGVNVGAYQPGGIAYAPQYRIG